MYVKKYYRVMPLHWWEEPHVVIEQVEVPDDEEPEEPDDSTHNNLAKEN